MSAFITRDGPGLAVSDVEARAARRYVHGSAALLKALGKMWPCGHIRTPETTHTIAGKAQCRRCRRIRWQRGVRIARARRASAALGTAEKRVEEFNHRAPGARLLPFCDMLDYVAECFEMTPGEVTGAKRKRANAHARSVLVKLLWDRGLSGSEIGRLLGGRDHSTIFFARDNFDIYARIDNRVLAAYEALRDSPRAA